MTRFTVKFVESGQLDDTASPAGTAIVRPLRHVRAVRECYLQRFADPAGAAASRSARAWAWALGETAVAPVTDRKTRVPPSRTEIEAEISTADEKRLRGDQENRADAAAIILRWLIGADDHVPVRGENPGELVGGFGDVVRSRKQIADVAALATRARRLAAARKLDVEADPGDRQLARDEVDYLGGVVATLAWVLGERAEAPITRAQPHEVTAIALKTERIYAEDVIEQGGKLRVANWLPLRSWSYGEGVEATTTWLLGDCIAPPIDPSGNQACGDARSTQ
jgi:hypothetical protein